MSRPKLLNEKLKLSSHKKVDNPIQTFNCQVCSKTYAQRKHLNRHVLTYQEKTVQCKTCGNKFTRADYLKIHERIHTGEKPYKCELCPKLFSSPSNLTKHRLSHSKDKIYCCPFCDKKFGQRATLNRHIRLHTGEMPYSCEHCNNRFNVGSSLSRHIKAVHLKNVSKFMCFVCLKTLRSAQSLKNHMHIHTGEKPHQCPVCKKRFRQQTTVTAHLRTHTGEKPFGCEICRKGYPQKSQLSNHIRVHLGEKYWKCPICLKEFFTHRGLYLHQQSIHGTRLKHNCVICDKSFHFLHNLTQHVIHHTKEKPFTCRVCGAEFAEKSCAKRHMQTHIQTEKAFECIICIKRFAALRYLLEHTQAHTHERPYLCKFCGKDFRYYNVGKRHERKCCKMGIKR